MSGILPDNGVPPSDTQNGIANPYLATGCENLFYAARCDPKFSPFAMNAVISEIINLLNYMGKPYDCSKLDNLGLMLVQMAAGQMTYNVTTGDANNRALALPPQFDKVGLVAGFTVTIKSHAANTGNMTIDVDGLGARQILSASGAQLSPGSVAANEILVLTFDGTNWIAVTKTVSDAWSNRLGIGQVYFVDTSLSGVDIPPSGIGSGAAFIQLTAGLMGSNQFNSGKLDDEQISGVFPTNTARARITLAGSPMIGQYVHLLNTEGRIQRPSTAPGVPVQDAFQGHGHKCPDSGPLPPGQERPVTLIQMDPGSGFYNLVSGGEQLPFRLDSGGTNCDPSDNGYGAPRFTTETRMKNLGVTAYMRIR